MTLLSLATRIGSPDLVVDNPFGERWTLQPGYRTALHQTPQCSNEGNGSISPDHIALLPLGGYYQSSDPTIAQVLTRTRWIQTPCPVLACIGERRRVD